MFSQSSISSCHTLVQLQFIHLGGPYDWLNYCGFTCLRIYYQSKCMLMDWSKSRNAQKDPSYSKICITLLTKTPKSNKQGCPLLSIKSNAMVVHDAVNYPSNVDGFMQSFPLEGILDYGSWVED